MSVALNGNLRDFGIAEVFQLIGQQRKTGRLVVGDGEDSIFLAFDEGCVVRGGPTTAESDSVTLGLQLVKSGFLTRDQLADLQSESERSARPLSDLLVASGLVDEETLEDIQHLLTRETVFNVIRRQDGNFNFSAESIVHETPPEKLLGAEQILMDGLRMLDEWRTFADVVPSEESVFRRVGSLETARALTKGDAGPRLGHAERVLGLIDGRLNVRRIIDLSRLGTFDATRALAELRQAGVIDLGTTKKRVARPAMPGTTSGNWIPALRVAFGSFLPILALGYMLVLMLPGLSPIGVRAGAAIPERHSEQMGRRFETELIRQLVEERRFETGSYPVALSEIEARVTQQSHTLTPLRLSAYYYAVRDDEVVLLPPVR